MPRAGIVDARHYQGARAEAEHALTVSPNLASAHGILGATLIFSGRPKEGLVALQRGIRLDPRDPRSGVSVNQVVLGLYFCGEYEACIEAAARVIRSYPDHPLVYRWLAAALGQTGRLEEAREALKRAIAIAPASFDFYVRQRALAPPRGLRAYPRGPAPGGVGGLMV